METDVVIINHQNRYSITCISKYYKFGELIGELIIVHRAGNRSDGYFEAV